MKKFLKLTELSKNEMGKVVGGQCTVLITRIVRTCGCSCAYANQGGSSTQDNLSANAAQGLHSPGM